LPPLSILGRNYYYHFDLNIMPNTFLKTTSTMFVPPYLIGLIDPNEEKVTLPYPNPTILPTNLSYLGHPPPSSSYAIRSNILPYPMNLGLTPKLL